MQVGGFVGHQIFRLGGSYDQADGFAVEPRELLRLAGRAYPHVATTFARRIFLERLVGRNFKVVVTRVSRGGFLGQ